MTLSRISYSGSLWIALLFLNSTGIAGSCFDSTSVSDLQKSATICEVNGSRNTQKDIPLCSVSQLDSVTKVKLVIASDSRRVVGSFEWISLKGSSCLQLKGCVAPDTSRVVYSSVVRVFCFCGNGTIKEVHLPSGKSIDAILNGARLKKTSTRKNGYGSSSSSAGQVGK